MAYECKRNQVLTSGTHLVEVDLLRGGKPFPISTQNLGEYRILICRGDRRPTGELYAFGLRQTISAVPNKPNGWFALSETDRTSAV